MTCSATATWRPGAALDLHRLGHDHPGRPRRRLRLNIATASAGHVTSNTVSETVTADPEPELTPGQDRDASTVLDRRRPDPYTLPRHQHRQRHAAGPFTVSDDQAANVTCPPRRPSPPARASPARPSDTVTQADLDAGTSPTSRRRAPLGHDSNTDTETVVAVPKPELDVVKTRTPSIYDRSVTSSTTATSSPTPAT